MPLSDKNPTQSSQRTKQEAAPGKLYLEIPRRMLISRFSRPLGRTCPDHAATAKTKASCVARPETCPSKTGVLNRRRRAVNERWMGCSARFGLAGRWSSNRGGR